MHIYAPHGSPGVLLGSLSENGLFGGVAPQLGLPSLLERTDGQTDGRTDGRTDPLSAGLPYTRKRSAGVAQPSTRHGASLSAHASTRGRVLSQAGVALLRCRYIIYAQARLS